MLVAPGSVAHAADDPTVGDKSIDGKYLDKEGNPTFKVARRRHGGLVHLFRLPPLSFGMPRLPRPLMAMGSTYAPALKDSLKTMSYGDFLNVVASGRKNVIIVAGECDAGVRRQSQRRLLLDDLYIYLRARANDALGRVRPAKREDKPEVAKQEEASCMGNKG